MLTKKDVEKLKETFATKEDLKKSAEEIKRHFDVVAEDIKNSIVFLAEQIPNKDDKISKIEEHEEKIENLNTDVVALKSRVSAVEIKDGK